MNYLSILYLTLASLGSLKLMVLKLFQKKDVVHSTYSHVIKTYILKTEFILSPKKDSDMIEWTGSLTYETRKNKHSSELRF